MNEPQGGLPIGELAQRAGVPAPTLRSWEGRYGFPRPQRLAGGHRRYDRGDIALIEEVLRLRALGMSLQAAIGAATTRTGEIERSVFASLRRRHPDLVSQTLRKTTLLALTRAIEDECCARAEQAALFACFQHPRYYRPSQGRWNELARTARVVVVFAGCDESEPEPEPAPWLGLGPEREPAPAQTGRAPVRISLPADAPLRREWSLVCEARDWHACVSGWEFPGQEHAGDAGRRFEVIWSVDPRVVRNAVTICAQLAESLSPGLSLLGDLPSDPPPAASADLRRAAGLINRMTGYLEQA